MSKYNALKILKKTKARIGHRCQNCGSIITIRKFYYSLQLNERVNCPGFHRKEFCEDCYHKFGKNY
jgi:hypothetical protein